jgi:hypothetical protein
VWYFCHTPLLAVEDMLGRSWRVSCIAKRHARGRTT